VSLILAGLVLAGTSGAVIVGRWIARRRKNAGANEANEANDDERNKDDKEKTEKKETREKTETKDDKDDAQSHASDDPMTGDPKKGDKKPGEPDGRPKARPLPGGNAPHLAGFPCQLGDVLMRITGEEAWLAGGVVFSEEVPVAALFVAPDAGHDCAIYVRPAPREVVYWLEPLDPAAVLVAGEPPSAVEHAGVRFDRARRLPLRPRRIGVGAPDVGDSVVLAEYISAGAERLLVMKATTGVVRAFRGLELETSAFEVIPSGQTTLGDT
jgi:hypothetical protein